MTRKYRRWGKLAKVFVAVAVRPQDHPTRERTDPVLLVVNVSVSVTDGVPAGLSAHWLRCLGAPIRRRRERDTPGVPRFYDEWMAERRLLSVNVECYAGHRGEQTPRGLILGDRRIAVVEVLDAWLAPEYRYFKLKGADGDTYLVRHDERTGIWELTMFRAERFRLAT